MRQLVSSTLAALCLASTLSAQTRTTAERLGYPRGAKLLILHADDIGVAHSENAASFDALDKGAVNSGSIMMPTPCTCVCRTRRPNDGRTTISTSSAT
jgi:hypothetical protein